MVRWLEGVAGPETRRERESDAHSLSVRHLTLHRTIADGGGNQLPCSSDGDAGRA